MDVSQDHELTLIERGTDVQLNYPLTVQQGIHDSRPARWESWTPHPSDLQKDGEGAHKQAREPVPIALSGPRVRGSTHGYTSWTCTEHRRMSYARTAPPRPAETLSKPAETNTSRTEKTL
jgi:hypothetical protein